jgi:putative MFS transporter
VNDPMDGNDGEAARETAPPEQPTRAKRPWWLPHFLGRVPIGLESKYVSLVGVVALAGLFENYDLSVLSAALKQIRESFELDQAEMTSLLAWVRLGAIPAFLILPLADRIGRRRVFLVAVIGMSVATVLSGLAVTPLHFVIAQTIARTFVVATIATAVVIVAEELPAEHRGWGIGMLGAIGAFGYGLGALLYAFVDTLPYGWRSLYFVGGLPLLFMPMLRRRVPETSRFSQGQRERDSQAEPPGFLQPLFELLVRHPARSFAVAAMALSFAIGAGPAFGLLSDFVQTTHGWQPSTYSMMAILAGAFGIIGNPAMGWAADRVGRRPIAMVAFGVYPLVAFAIYFGPGAGIPVLWIPFVFILSGTNVLMRIIASELFPTSSRNTALGWETLCETLGGAIGFALVGGLTATSASIAPAVVAVSTLTVLGVAVVWMLPETAGRELEATSGFAGPDAQN